MTPEQIELVERSLEQARPRLADLVDDFYVRLFASDPEVADLFTTDPAVQRARFAAELETIAATIRRHDAFLLEVRRLGARHVEYGVRAADYRLAGPALLGALAASLGDAWTDDVALAWRLAYNLTAETMMAGAAEDR